MEHKTKTISTLHPFVAFIWTHMPLHLPKAAVFMYVTSTQFAFINLLTLCFLWLFHVMLSMALMAALFQKPCMNLSMSMSNSTLFLQPTGLSLSLSILLSSSLSLSPPTAHTPACSSLIRLCMFVFVRI